MQRPNLTYKTRTALTAASERIESGQAPNNPCVVSLPVPDVDIPLYPSALVRAACPQNASL
jgi:hypothetical protein